MGENSIYEYESLPFALPRITHSFCLSLSTHLILPIRRLHPQRRPEPLPRLAHSPPGMPAPDYSLHTHHGRQQPVGVVVGGLQVAHQQAVDAAADVALDGSGGALLEAGLGREREREREG